LQSLKQWLEETLVKLSKKSDTAIAVRYALGRWGALMRYCDDGRLEIDDNAERALRAVALGRKNYLFAGSDRGGESAAAIYSLIGTAKLTGSILKVICATSCRASRNIRSATSTNCYPGALRFADRSGGAWA
jgi:hypothetical protein